MVRTSRSHCRGTDLIPGQGTKMIAHVVWLGGMGIEDISSMSVCLSSLLPVLPVFQISS